jgi:acetylornithine deacetylase/succinyl-diaminopimelate desuccinylase-like protein
MDIIMITNTSEGQMSKAHEYAQQHRDEFRQQLHQLLRIPSVSTSPQHAGDVRRAAEWLKTEMLRIGFESAEVIHTPGHPIVYGEWLGAGETAPTILIYGHYDVQPAEMIDGWTHDPFDPIERDGKIYARGSTDDKGQTFVHLKAIESLLQTEGTLPVNIKLLIEGEEEVSSLNLGAFVSANQDRLKADVCVISDTAILAVDQPSIVYALRGLTYMEIHVHGPQTDLHSGVFGGTVHNPAQALAEIITALHQPDGSVSVPGFYDDVLTLDEEERAELKKTDWALDDWAKATGLDHPWGEAQYTLRERVGARPTLEVNGMVSGFYGEGAKTVLPAKALAKISCRLVANQDPQRIYELVRDYVAQITPPTVRSEVRLLHTGDAAFVDRHTPVMQAAIQAYTQGWGKPPVFMREGGSIPIVANFQRELGLPVILMGFGLNTDGAHGPDEHFTIEMFHKGIDTVIHFFKLMGRK